ncbi:MAG: hypothetical protein HOC79_00940 [Euryarchaeota archaeon]|nr:hypothetical protein [Euryarchaeota archaeon]
MNGKGQPQVIACVLRTDEGRITTTSLVRDGKTSLSRFSCDSEGEALIPIPDIERLIGVLKAHGPEVTLEHLTEGIGKLRVKSGRKQTTLIAEGEGLAFPHSPDTISQWEEKSISRANQIVEKGYQMANGEVREPFFQYHFEDAGELSSALKCDNINSQRLNRYHFELSEGTFKVKVGEELKGATEIEFGEASGDNFDASFEGGLENVLSEYNGRPVTLQYLDFRPEGQGIRVIVRLPDEDWVFQAGVL